MNKLIKSILNIRYLGIQYSDSFELTKQIILLNYLTLLYVILPLPYIGFYLWINLPIFAGAIPIVVLFFLEHQYLLRNKFQKIWVQQYYSPP